MADSNTLLVPDQSEWTSFMTAEDDGIDILPTIIRMDSAEIVYSDEEPRVSFIAGKYLKGTLLGDGSYSKVKEALDIETLCRRAIKIVKMRTIRKIPNGYLNVKREIKILKRLQHPNVISLIEEFFNEEKQKLYIVLEYCCCNLQAMLDKAVNKYFPEWQAHYYFVQLIAGLEYLHSKGIIHKDIKPGNLLLTIDQLLKITDLGVSEELNPFAYDDAITTSQGSPVFQAPEIADGAESFSGYKIDIWSCGITLYRMCIKEYPFDGLNIYQLYDNIVKKDIVIPDHCTDHLNALITGMLDKNSERRFSIAQIRETLWFKQQKPAIAGEAVPMPSVTGNSSFSMSMLPDLKVLIGANDAAISENGGSSLEISTSHPSSFTNNHNDTNQNVDSKNNSAAYSGAVHPSSHAEHRPKSKHHSKSKCVIY